MRVLKAWNGDFNSTLYLQEIDYKGKIFLTIMYGFSMIGGNRYEGGETFSILDLDNEISKLVALINRDFRGNVLVEMRQCVADYNKGIEIKRWEPLQ